MNHELDHEEEHLITKKNTLEVYPTGTWIESMIRRVIFIITGESVIYSLLVRMIIKSINLNYRTSHDYVVVLSRSSNSVRDQAL